MWLWFAFPLWPRDGKHFFMCFLAISIFSFEKALFSSVIHFFIGSLVFWGSLDFVYSGYHSVQCIAGKDFLQFFGWLLQFRNHFLYCSEAFEFHVANLSTLFLSCWATWVLVRKSLPMPSASSVFPALSCTSFKV
jgi:hypothetical protein